MITISLCMIVKNEERVLARCLNSLAGLMDEIIIVDTGSTDATRQIAARYTDRIYDFEWIDDFSAARNFAFSKATREYIYTADADEVLSEENRELFRQLKATLLPQIEIVQMKYGNQLQFGSVYNYDEELRPKLFKRCRIFVWEEPIHETVRLAPVVYDSDIVITHMPGESHALRDLNNFRRQTAEGKKLSARLHGMYARELFLAGTEEDFLTAADYFEAAAKDVTLGNDAAVESFCVAARAAHIRGDMAAFLKYTAKLLAGESCSEICCELGHFYEEQQDYEEAVIWYYNAVYETAPVICAACGDRVGLEGLIRCYERVGMPEQALVYQTELDEKSKT